MLLVMVFFFLLLLAACRHRTGCRWLTGAAQARESTRKRIEKEQFLLLLPGGKKQEGWRVSLGRAGVRVLGRAVPRRTELGWLEPKGHPRSGSWRGRNSARQTFIYSLLLVHINMLPQTSPSLSRGHHRSRSLISTEACSCVSGDGCGVGEAS